MMFPLRILIFLFLASVGSTAAQTNTCRVPDQMKKDQKLPCVRAGSFMVDQPALTVAQLSNGPDFNAAEPEKSRFAYFTAADNVLCYFRPHYAFMSVKGDSMKFQCWHMTADGAFYSPAGEIIRVESVKVVIETDKNGEKKVSLFAGNDANNAHEIKADHFKVKYLKPPYPNHNTRYNEVFTEIAATRIMWVLGFPADHVYPLGSAACIGCTADPFDSNLKDNTASLKDTPNIFKVVSAERETPWEQINPKTMRRGPGVTLPSFMLTGSGRISREWNTTPTGLPWVCFITTMQLPNRTGSLARSGRQRRLANPESASGL